MQIFNIGSFRQPTNVKKISNSEQERKKIKHKNANRISVSEI